MFEKRYGRERCRRYSTTSARAAGEAAGRAAQRLAQRAGDDVHALHDAMMLRRAAAGGSQHAGRMAVIDDHRRIIALGQVANRRQRSHGAVHREDAIGDDQPSPRPLGLLQTAFQLGHVGVPIAEAPSLAQADAVDDAGVVQLVAEDRVVVAQ